MDPNELFDFSEVRDEDAFETTSYVTKGGMCHAQVTSVDTDKLYNPTDERGEAITPRVTLQCVVLGHDDAEQVGRTFREMVFFTDKTRDRVSRWVLTLGLVPPGQKGTPDWNRALGRDFCCRLEGDEYVHNGETRTKHKVGFMDFWRPSNPKVANCPRGKPHAIDGAATQPKAAPQKATVGKSDWSTL